MADRTAEHSGGTSRDYQRGGAAFPGLGCPRPALPVGGIPAREKLLRLFGNLVMFRLNVLQSGLPFADHALPGTRVSGLKLGFLALVLFLHQLRVGFIAHLTGAALLLVLGGRLHPFESAAIFQVDASLPVARIG